MFFCQIDDTNLCWAAGQAAADLTAGNIVAVPTDTIYGVACLVQVATAVDKLYALKGRHPEKSISICLPDPGDLPTWADTSPVEAGLLTDLLPGPVTLCFDRSPDLNPAFNPDARLVGVRVPDAPFVREVCRRVGATPVALTSANLSQAQSCLEVPEFLGALGHGLASVFDGGRLGSDRQGSTIINLSQKGHYRVMRNGSALNETIAILHKHGLKEL